MKYENTRIVTFKEDYNIKTRDGGTRVLHKAGSRIAIHKGIVTILEKNKAKITVETLDAKKIEEKMKHEFEKKKRAQVTA